MPMKSSSFLIKMSKEDRNHSHIEEGMKSITASGNSDSIDMTELLTILCMSSIDPVSNLKNINHQLMDMKVGYQPH